LGLSTWNLPTSSVKSKRSHNPQRATARRDPGWSVPRWRGHGLA
jgi:hypothetical protein